MILHILPFDQARGAQRYARDLVDILTGLGEEHRILTLFESEPVAALSDDSLAVPIGRLRRMGFDFRVLFLLRKYLRRHQPTAVIAHGGESAKYAAASVSSRIPWVYLKIGTNHPTLEKQVRMLFHRLYARRADLMVAVSNDVAAEAVRMTRLEPERVIVIPNARDANLFAPGAERDVGNPPRLIFVGHLDRGKRPDLYLESVGELRTRGYEFSAQLVGDGPLEESIRSYAEAVGVDMLGRRNDVPDLMASSDVLVFTSRPEGEGMPGVLIEAGLSGVAIVSTRVPGAADVVLDGVTGFLVDVDDAEGLVSSIARLISDESLRTSMARRARDHCLARFSLETFVEHWESALGSLDTDT